MVKELRKDIVVEALKETKYKTFYYEKKLRKE